MNDEGQRTGSNNPLRRLSKARSSRHHHSSFSLLQLPLALCLSSIALRPSPFVFRPLSFVLRPSSIALCLSPFVFRPSSFVLRPLSFVLCHPPFVADACSSPAWRVIQSAWPYLPGVTPVEREGSPIRLACFRIHLSATTESDRRSFALNTRVSQYGWSGALDDTLCATHADWVTRTCGGQVDWMTRHARRKRSGRQAQARSRHRADTPCATRADWVTRRARRKRTG